MDMASANSFRTRARGDGDRIALLTLADIEQTEFITAWQQLAHRSCEPNPFYEPWFLIPSLRLGNMAEKVVIKAWYHAGRLRWLLAQCRLLRPPCAPCRRLAACQRFLRGAADRCGT